MTDLILFDMDGTLIDSSALIVGCMQGTARELGIAPPTREAVAGVVGLTLDIALTELFGDEAPVELMTATYSRLFRSLHGTPGFEENHFAGIPEALDACGARPATKLGIATGKRMPGVDRVLALHGWRERFATFQTPDSAPSKPHPGMILNGMREVGAVSSRTIMIGDSVHDMRMAKAAGVHAIAVAWGLQPAALLVEAGADVVALRTSDLPEIVEDLLKG